MSYQSNSSIRIIYIFILLFCFNSGSSCAPLRILAIKTRDIPFYQPALQGFTKGLQDLGYTAGDKVEITTIALTGDEGHDRQAVHEQLQKGYQLIFTLGTDATQMVAGEHPSVPVLFSMILDPVRLGLANSLDVPGGQFTGTTLVVNPGKQFETMLQVVPNMKRIGVLYTEGDPMSSAFLDEARQDAKQVNLEIVAQGIQGDKPDDRKAMLESLSTHVDAFWLILDPASMGPQALADTMACAAAHHLPVLGGSATTVRAGGLLALSANFEDLGEVSAQMAVPLLEGTVATAQMRIRGPRQTTLTINLDEAASLKLTVPDAVLHLADEVVSSVSNPKANR